MGRRRGKAFLNSFRSTKPVDTPSCYKDNSESLEKRATLEEKKQREDEEQFLKWYESELMKHNPTPQQLRLLQAEKNRRRK